MSEELLREYLREVMLTEVRLDVPFINHLKRTAGLPVSGMKTMPGQEGFNFDNSIADEFIQDLEDDIGKKLHPNKKAQLRRFVAQRMPGLYKRFRGNMGSAEQTMYNILNTRFNSLRTDDRK